jgi:hypothetical protein
MKVTMLGGDTTQSTPIDIGCDKFFDHTQSAIFRGNFQCVTSIVVFIIARFHQ